MTWNWDTEGADIYENRLSCIKSTDFGETIVEIARPPLLAFGFRRVILGDSITGESGYGRIITPTPKDSRES